MLPPSLMEDVMSYHINTNAMTHFALNEMTIKSEPLSPNSAEQVLSHMVSSPSAHTANTLPSPGPGLGMVRPSPVPVLPSNDTRNALKSSILIKRKLRGETTLPSLDDGPKECKMTKRDIQRKEARKEQNRRAARKCRIKKKSIQQRAENEMASARKENVEMRTEVFNLRQQIVQLQKIISDHEISQNCRLDVHNAFHHHNNTPPPTEPRLQCLPGPMGSIGVNTMCSSTPPFQHIPTLSPPNPHHAGLPTAPSEILSNSVTSAPDMLPQPVSEPCSFLHEFTSDGNVHSDSESGFGNLPSWDLKNIDSDFKLDPEVPPAIIESLLRGDYGNMDEYETPKADGEVKMNEKLSFSCPSVTETPQTTVMSNKTTDSKPTVVRNLSRFFAQTDLNSISKSQQHPQHQQSTRKNAPPPLKLNNQNTPCAFLNDNNLSSTIFSCVSPNLIQPPMVPVSKVPTSNVHTCQQTSNSGLVSGYTPFESQVIAQNSHRQLRIEPRDSNESGLFEPNAFVEDNQNNHIFNDLRDICDSSSFIFPPPEVTVTTSYCNSNDQRDGDMFSPSGLNNSPGFAYQLSPISVSSPSNASNRSSPGFLLSPNQELCNSTIFEFNGL